ncbi:MAG TPA: DUF1566 domain-containing protein [Polyangiaceae bacterium]|jgi:hypothetical protein
MAASRTRVAAVVAGASALALVACDTILDLGQYQDVPCALDCDSGLESSVAHPMDAAAEADVARVESGIDAAADSDSGMDADADVVTMPEGGWPVPTAHELWAHWPMPNPDAATAPESSTALPNPMSYDAGADGGGAVVYDAVTKLTWSRQAKAAASYTEAWTACGALASTWRLPTRIELASLIDFTRTPTLDTIAFLDAGGVPTWTSSAVAGDDGPAGYWYVDFGTGLTGYGGPSVPSQVLCVSGGTP